MISFSSPKGGTLIRLVCFLFLFGLIISSLPIGPYQLAHSSGRYRRMKGLTIPTNLPNLDELRRMNPATPKAPPPVPATKCRGRDEMCKQKLKQQTGI